MIHVSVDGLRPDAVTNLGAAGAPNFSRLRAEGAWTHNARTDYDYSITLPNHTCQLTGRPVLGAAGHGWITNSDPLPGQTLHTVKGSYVAGAFDVAHDAGLRTAEYASKSKFSLYATSWDATNGALDVWGADNGRKKIDLYRNNTDTLALVTAVVNDALAQPYHYVFLHLADADNAGHSCGWDPAVGSCYSNAVKKVDGELGTLLAWIETDARLQGRTVLLVTADHGGTGTDHSNATLAVNYTIPFYVWGAGVTAGADLYALNPGTRASPGTSRPNYAATPPPVRNGDAANLALRLLGLGPVPGSSIGVAQPLAVALPVPGDLQVTLIAAGPRVTFTSRVGFRYDVHSSSHPGTEWTPRVTNLVGTGATLEYVDTTAVGVASRFYRVTVHP